MRRLSMIDKDTEPVPTRAILRGRFISPRRKNLRPTDPFQPPPQDPGKLIFRPEPFQPPPQGKGFKPFEKFQPYRRWAFGLSEGPVATPGTPAPLGFWGGLGSALGGIVSSVLPTFAQIEIGKRQAAAGAALYTPQNIEILRRQAEYEAQSRANMAAAAAGTTSAPINTNTLLLVGGGVAALLLFLNMKKS